MKKNDRGIIVGCDRGQEWLMSWWWSHYNAHNKFPVTFADFGLTERALKWCSERGEVMQVEKKAVCSKENIDPATAKHWEAVYGPQIWPERDTWFMKPIALGATPYERTIWLDLDCEVLKPLDHLFTACDHPSGIALAAESESTQHRERRRKHLLPDEMIYNAGVIAFKKDSHVIAKWAAQAYEQTQTIWSDQHLLARIIFTDKIEINQLSSEYNWCMAWGLNINAVIIHWFGPWGKQIIRQHGGYHEFTKNLL